MASKRFLENPTILQQLLEEINFQRAKDMRQSTKDESGFVMLQGTTYWTDLFVRHFLFLAESGMDCDDLLFFVRKKHIKSSPRFMPKFESEVDVHRKDSRKLPIGDPDIDWEETVYLNLIVHQFEYTLTVAICSRTSPKELQVLKRHSQKVYASPSRRRMDTKGDTEDFTYPHICFMVDNFDEVFQDILVRDGEMVCVELVAADRTRNIQGVLFLGSIRYDALKKVYDTRSSLSNKMAQRMTLFGLFSGASTQRCEFVRMKGPQGKGHAEMAVTKPKGAGVETPTSEPGFCQTDMWDSDWEEDPDDFYVYRNQRRLSDPSSNINNFVKGGWTTKSKLECKSRSENEGLDELDQGVSEIEAGDLRDGHPASSCRCSTLYFSSTASLTSLSTPKRSKSSRCGCFALKRSPFERKQHPLILMEVRQHQCPTQLNSNDITLERKMQLSTTDSIQLPSRRYLRRIWLHNGCLKIPPNRLTSDGTRIFYWCDLNNNSKESSELDDGAYNPLWTMRGFTQTFHFWKENKRAQSVPLNAYLTYVTLPWWSIAKDLLDHREEPILTF